MMNLEGVRLKLEDLNDAKEETKCILSMEEENNYVTIILMWSWCMECKKQSKCRGTERNIGRSA
jgi:hypothetical protein